MTIFSTRDLNLAATLVNLKFTLEGIDYQIEGDKNSPVGYFKFEDTPALQKAKSDFSQGKLLVEPKSFLMELRSLKAEISNMYKNPHLNN